MQLLELAPASTQVTSPTRTRTRTRTSHGNDLIFFCDVDASNKLNCHWIQGCLI